MKKGILFFTGLVLFPTYIWATECVSNGGRYPDCSEMHHFLMEDINLDYFYVPEPKILHSLSYLEEDLLNVPDFSQKEECIKTKDPACEKLKEVEQYQQKISDWNTSKEKQDLLQENSEVERKNRSISIKNKFIYENNSLYDIYRRMVKIEGLYTTCSTVYRDGIKADWRYLDAGLLISLYPNPTTPLQKEINNYLETVNEVISNNFYRQEDNKKIREENLKTEKENAEIEKENAKIEKQFREYYTPEKTKQLIKDYEKVLSEKCVGCDYSQPLNISEYECKECPNREYVNGKCVLKKRIKKGVKK